MASTTFFDPNTTTQPTYEPLNPIIDSSKVNLDNLSPEEQDFLKEIIALTCKTINETERPSDGDVIDKPVSLNQESSPEIEEIAINAGIVKEKNPLDTMAEIEARCQKELDVAKLNSDEPKVNYLTQMSRLIAEISTLLNQWTNRDNHRSEVKKAEYTEASTAIEYNQYSKGGWNLALGVVGAALSAWSPNASLGPLQQSINNFLDGQGTKPSQENQMTLQTLQKLSEASSSNADLRQKALEVLQAIRDWATAAARHG
ncbi:MAG TPA: hypothetical protein VGO47_14180 [Chlamydiales bacterium]|jgi:hypothetical protein|nr:hypothetical protein [Chlamydiales bacterium]